MLDRDHAADADAGDARAARARASIAIFGDMGGIAGIVALFVVAGTFGLAIAQRRRETAVLRALGATPSQVRRLISGEALIVSLVATVLGVLAGGPLADAIASAVVDHGVAPHGFAPGRLLDPARRRARPRHRHRPARRRRRRAPRRPGPPGRGAARGRDRAPAPGDRARPRRARCLGGGAAMALLFSGEAAGAFAILGAMLLATGVALLGRWLLGLPAAALARPLRRLGAPGLLAGTSLTANRWRSAALATPIVLVAMLVGTQGVLQDSDERDTERVTAARVTAEHVVVGRDGAPLPAGTARGSPGCRASRRPRGRCRPRCSCSTRA